MRSFSIEKHRVIFFIALAVGVFFAGRKLTVEQLYAYLESSRLELNPVNTDAFERDDERFRVLQELERVALMPFTTKCELYRTPISFENNFLNKTERNGHITNNGQS